jgi:hypothetical protein
LSQRSNSSMQAPNPWALRAVSLIRSSTSPPLASAPFSSVALITQASPERAGTLGVTVTSNGSGSPGKRSSRIARDGRPRAGRLLAR